MSSSKKVVPIRKSPQSEVPEQAPEAFSKQKIARLAESIRTKVEKDPKKAAQVVTEWLDRPARKKIPTKKSA